MQKQKHCLRHSEYNETQGYAISNLLPGNHSYRIRATSLAGPGPWTGYKHFIVLDLGQYVQYEAEFDDCFIQIL